MKTIIKICWYSFLDRVRNKSLYILLGVSLLCLLLFRGCYSGNITTNGENLDELTKAWWISKTAFHLFACLSYLLAILLAMSFFSEDKKNGLMVFYLSKPISRGTYLFGSIGGIWLVSVLFMVVTHLAVLIMNFMLTGGIIYEYIPASILCSLNHLYWISLIMLLSLFLPDFMAALIGCVIGGVTLLSDLYTAIVSKFQQASANEGVTILLPKIMDVQFTAVSLIDKSEASWGAVLNISLYSLVFLAILYAVFSKKELTF